MLPAVPAVEADARKYCGTDPETAICCETMVEAGTVVNVIRSAQVELFADDWTLIVVTPPVMLLAVT